MRQFSFSARARACGIALALLCMALPFSCKKKAPQADSGTAASGKPQQAIVWHRYYEPQNKAFLYISEKDGTLSAVVCTYVAEIDLDCSFRLSHPCTQEQFALVQEKLVENGMEPRGSTDKPDTAGYADMSDYIPFVLSSDELAQLWLRLGLGEDD